MRERYPRFPVFIRLDDRQILFFGAGSVAKRRIQVLLSFGAKIQVIAPKIPGSVEEQFRTWIKTGQVHYKKKQFEETDLEKSMFMVFAATDKPEVNAMIARLCRKRGIPVNNASDASDCDFFFPSVVRKEDIVIGITGNGEDHRKVREVREMIQWKSDEKEEHICL
ncbi:MULTISPECIES: precorrin-2 dehydrogenase/sirohydrochlorin ferrochelatase family protein [Sellimonas]|uniref:precorrin-2 dehydrogenase n=1 Tax=Sellimonas caecigallum TaxID=2592333 RepID=A0ABS7L3G7_9FIRM|nr:bifunctional precorrin-2 dehydrogenase/sirohydrochlorin ferrochelatase [Sellimonas sp.]MBY0757598.1 bifunctional precorrin-2 dehydrogenase/sirohydrochlorin ferrochelatase [Sellimonas caecigallum]OUP64988.1 hypothetical protein B5F13_06650 [Drancourtella sp. An177]